MDEQAKEAVEIIAEYCDRHDDMCMDVEGKSCIFCLREKGKYDRCFLYGKFPYCFSVPGED